ncbi:hypothetical protein [Nocardia huaxiensis]|uniref:Uncharacterized protein n=1 Tax=Nocardia huaxiensis TaxID=2755382 RepID=A0A7D6Z9V7_9NOCA|nr:hypothetical protein [Nocardia huaxiensis]QLY30628.1 hypothetical protein H0264_36910 [Nocardia huaxiensis]UFS95765.1 hypothetical protein LPY97_34765 [Nocardia huaxiensis]
MLGTPDMSGPDGDLNPRSLAAVVAISGLMVLAIGAGMLLTGTGDHPSTIGSEPRTRTTHTATPSPPPGAGPVVTAPPAPARVPAAEIPVAPPVIPSVSAPTPVAPPEVNFDVPPVE